MNIVLYAERCTSCGQFGNTVRELRRWCSRNGHMLHLKGTSSNKNNRQEAKELSEKFGVSKPFVYCKESGNATENLKNINSIL